MNDNESCQLDERQLIRKNMAEIMNEMHWARRIHGRLPARLRPEPDLCKASVNLEMAARREHPMSAFAILCEEVGEVGRAIEMGATASVRAELVQVAAMALSFICELDRIAAGGTGDRPGR